MRKLIKKKKPIVISVTILVVLLFLVIFLFVLNKKHNEIYVYNEVTFINPTEALIFWKTKVETLGYIKYGESKYGRDKVQSQTSSQPGEIHAVLLEKIPRDGLFVSIHNESDSIFIFPKIFKIQFAEED
jgi:hypothetical protein